MCVPLHFCIHDLFFGEKKIVVTCVVIARKKDGRICTIREKEDVAAIFVFFYPPAKYGAGFALEIYEFQRSLAKDDREDRSEFSSIRSKNF